MRFKNIMISNIYKVLLTNALHTSFYFKMLIFSHFDIFEVDDVS